MIFHSVHDRRFATTIGPRRYTVAPGAEVEIPDRLAYVVRARGLPLREGPAPGAAARAPSEPVPPPPPPPPPSAEVEALAAGLDPDELAAAGLLEESAPADPAALAGPVGDAVTRLQSAGVQLPGARAPRRASR